MPTLTIESATDAERIELERAIADVQEMGRLGATAAHGTVLDACESFTLGAGRQLLRDNLAATAQARADADGSGRRVTVRGGVGRGGGADRRGPGEHPRRLAGGRSIGSGAVAGTIQQQVNLRLKRTGARWRVEHVGPLVELRALSHTPDWQTLGAAA